MAKLIDIPENLDEDREESVFDEEEPTTEEPAQAASTEEVELPDKYKGKSVQDLVRMHQEAESALGRKGSEVGELRKIVDDYITSQIVENTPKKAPVQPQQEEEEETDWFIDPDSALDKKLNSHPVVQELQKEAQNNRRTASLAKLTQKHPDFKEVMQDSDFVNWVKSSKIRTQLFIQADQQFDLDAADELFSTYKERKALAEATVNADKQSRKAAAKNASTGGARGSGQTPAKKTFRRADIINLKNSDPERYQQLASEILLAYKEGRVV